MVCAILGLSARAPLHLKSTPTKTRFFFKSKIAMLLAFERWYVRKDVKEVAGKSSARPMHSNQTSRLSKGSWASQSFVLSIQASSSPVLPYLTRTSATSTPWGCHGRCRVAGARRDRGQSAAHHWQLLGQPRLPRRAHVNSGTSFANIVGSRRVKLVRGVSVMSLLPIA